MTSKEVYSSIMENNHLSISENEGINPNYVLISLKGNYVYMEATYNGAIHSTDRCPGDQGYGYVTGTSWWGAIHLAELPVQTRLALIKEPHQLFDIEAEENGYPSMMGYLEYIEIF